ncbi:kinase-like domain-containing protein [Cladochytrium replicatum]|nr:kinase-like domain-containing protein [Cladochytrium replicatum]
MAMEALLAKYELGDPLGSGAFSEVVRATERATGLQFAIKIIDRSKCRGKENMIETEVKILQKVRHENIIQLYEMFDMDNKIYLVMELVTGGELFDDIVNRGKYTEADAAKIVHRILMAIEYLHAKGIAHRDLKPENLLLSHKGADSKIMISDFGLSKIFNDEDVMRTACGTPGYVAPEVLQRQGYGHEVDLWSLGVITYILLCGYPPFYDKNNVKLFKQIMSGEYVFDRPWWDPVSEIAKDFIRHLLVLSPKARYTARQALNHPFITLNCGVTPELVEECRVSITGTEPKSNLAPNVQAHLKRAPSVRHVVTKVSFRSFQSALPNKIKELRGEDDTPEPRPLATKKSFDDSGIVKSNDSVNQQQAQAPRGSDETVNQQNAKKDGRKDVGKRTSSPKNGKGSPKNSVGGVEANSVGPVTQEARNSLSSPVQHAAFPSPQQQAHPSSNNAGSPNFPSTIMGHQQHLPSAQPQVYHPPNPGPIIGSPNHVRCMTYNLMCRPPGVKNNANDYKNARLAIFGEVAFKGMDIVCLQEVHAYGSGRQSKILASAKRAGLDYVVCSPSRGIMNTMVDAGLMILSRYPIVKSEKITYKRGLLGDRYISKGAIYAKIGISAVHHIHVFNTHLQSTFINTASDGTVIGGRRPASGSPASATSSSPFLPPDQSVNKDPAGIIATSQAPVGNKDAHGNAWMNDPCLVVRVNQLLALKDFIDDVFRTKAPHEPVVLLGDFNVNARRSVNPSESAQHVKPTDEYILMVKILKGEITAAAPPPPAPLAPVGTPKAVINPQLGQSPTASGIVNQVAAPAEPRPRQPLRLKIHDIALESMGVHPVTMGGDESVLTHPDVVRTRQCVDYVFALRTLDEEASMISGVPGRGLQVDQRSAQVEQFAVDGEPFTQLSDPVVMEASSVEMR